MMKTVLWKRLLCLFCAAALIPIAGCGSKAKVSKDPRTLNVMFLKQGFGSDWVYELKSKFEQAFSEEGYKVNILPPASDLAGAVLLTDMASGFDKTGVDLYISGNVTAEQVGEGGDYGVLAEDIRESVFNRKAIGYDGKEEAKLVSEKMPADLVKYAVDSHGVMYGFEYVKSSSGLAVNKKKLDAYGLSLPKTTDEMLDCFEKIYLGTNGIADSETTKTFPVTYFAGNNSYVVSAMLAWQAQYDLDEYYRFWSMQEKNEAGEPVDMLENGYEVFATDAVEEMLTLAYRVMDVRIAAYGSTTQNLDQAQAKLMKSGEGAVFMFNGDWLLNEVKANYGAYINDLTYINYPVVSAIGPRLMGSGTEYGLSDEKCEEILSYVIGLVDENKALGEIVEAVGRDKGVTLSESVVGEIATARGVYYERGNTNFALINKGTPKKDIASLFLRMMASDDFGRTFAEMANGATPYSPSAGVSKYEFTNAANRVAGNRYAKGIVGRLDTSGLRARIRLNNVFTSVPHIPSYIYNNILSVYKDGKIIEGASYGIYRDAAKDLQQKEYDYALGKWPDWIKRA